MDSQVTKVTKKYLVRILTFTIITNTTTDPQVYMGHRSILDGQPSYKGHKKVFGSNFDIH